MTARKQREVLSPIITTPNIQRNHPLLISPNTSKTNNSPSTLLMEQQDDELERKARRRSRVIDLQRKNLTSSPRASPDRRQSLPLSGLSTAQLTEHYTNCIKLSTENKINSKNAFGLHLIDYMSELLQKKELENFQVASTTLDASAKIYAGRVDAIHAETYKVLSGLGRSEKKPGEEDEAEDGAAPGHDEEDPEAEGAKQKKKKKVRKSKTVETNLKNISVNKFDLEFEVDPLFHMMSAAFDEGGSSGLLLNNLRTFDKTQELVLDSNTIITPVDELDTSRIEERRKAVDVSDFQEIFTDETRRLDLCPAFTSFEFTNWDSSNDSQVSVPGLSQTQTAEDHRFDVDAEPEPIPDAGDNMSMMGPGDGSYMDDLDVDEGADNILEDEETGVDHCIGDGKAARLVQSVLDNMTHGTTGALMQVLSTEPSDYSYFNKALLRTWAGPAHWKAGSLSRESWKSTLQNKTQKSKTKKPTFRLDFEEEIDFAAKLKLSKATALTKTALNKYSKDQTTLPKDHHYDADSMFRLFLLKRRMIRRQKESANVDDAIENYDYENANDRENFCPADDVDDDDSGEMDFGGFVGGGGDYSQDDEISSSQDPFSQSQDVFTQPATLDGTVLSGDKLLAQPYKSQDVFTQPATLDGTVLSGDKLLAQSYKVNKIEIDYAKTAKKLDVKRLKSSMWNLLKSATKPSEDNPGDENTNNNAAEQSTSSESGPSDPSKEMDGRLTFQELLNDLPEKVSGQTAKNLSVPIAFVCLLHLANEKTLKIEEKDMEDLIITQGL